MSQFFNTQFGIGLKAVSTKIGRVAPGQGQSIYKATRPSGSMRKGDHYYLDGLHKDHLEVFDKNGKFLRVLNLDGTVNSTKTAAAAGRSIKNILK